MLFNVGYDRVIGVQAMHRMHVFYAILDMSDQLVQIVLINRNSEAIRHGGVAVLSKNSCNNIACLYFRCCPAMNSYGKFEK